MSRYPSDDERRRAFEAEALPHLGRVFSTARYLSRIDSEAEDLAQETFLRAYRTFDNFAPGTNARAWLLTILHSVFSNRLRRRRLEPEAKPDEELEAGSSLWTAGTDGSGPDGAADGARTPGTGADLTAALGRLPEASRALVLLVDVEGFTYEEAADSLACPVGTVRSRLSRARRRLAVDLADYARGPADAGSEKR